jgi:hypothetical protein
MIRGALVTWGGLRATACAISSLVLIGGVARAAPAGGDADITTQEHGPPGISAEAHYGTSTPPPSAGASSSSDDDGSSASASASGPSTGSGVAASGPAEVSGVVTGLPPLTGPGHDSPISPHPCVQVKVGPLEGPGCSAPPPKRGGGGPGRPGGPGSAGPPPPSPEELALVVADRARAAAPRPRLRLAPSGVGLTGLNTYYWLAERPRPITAVAQVPGLTVVAEARPVQYVWRFGDGFEMVTSHPGTRWRPGHPGSVAHVYEIRGRYRVVVEVIWEARWRTGGDPWRSLGFFTTTGGRVYPVRQVVSRLIPGL